MKAMLMVILGGAAGAALRYKLSSLPSNELFPWGTLLVNGLGCLLAGILWQVSQRVDLLADLHLFIFTGFLGALTTFSAYTLDTCRLAEMQRWGPAVFNVVINNGLSIVLFVTGSAAGRWLAGLITPAPGT